MSTFDGGNLNEPRLSNRGDAPISNREGPSSSIDIWRKRIETSIARSRKIKGGNYVQIATVDENGHPRCRTVVFRGFVAFPHGIEGMQASSDALKMITDGRSEKVEQVSLRSSCELVWWFSQSSEQYRITGDLYLVSASETNADLLAQRKQQWGNLSDPAREQFYWSRPGVGFDGTPEVPKGGRDAEGKVLPPPETFLLVLLLPKQVKYLRLSDNLALVDEVSNEAGATKWSVQRVNP
jgi:PPOX class probable FMN-dependent enzyme